MRWLASPSAAGVVSAALLSVCGALSVHAAVPVEDMSTRDVRGDAGLPITTPQPVMPDELAVQPGGVRYTEPQPINPDAPVGVDPKLGSASPAARSGAGVQPGENAQRFYELQQLQSEILLLRGMIEDQAFEIKRLRDLQRSQYLDIDRRLTGQDSVVQDSAQNSVLASSVVRDSSVGAPAGTSQSSTAVSSGTVKVQTGESNNTTNAAKSAVIVESQPKATVVAEPVTTAVAVPDTESAPSEQVAYSQAFDLMKDQQFDRSIVAYQSVIEKFPDGRYAPESRYWLGELYLMSDRLEDARAAYNQVVTRFPAHQKVPLSLYKLGVVNHRLGGTLKALEFLDDVVVRYPDTPAAGLARTYAAELR